MQLDERRKELSDYRLSKANENLDASVVLYKKGFFAESVNRSYYAIFHSVRALTAYYDFDAKKHSSVISYFNRNFVKNKKIDVKYSKILTKAFKIRSDCDYEDFFVVSKEDSKEQLENAKLFLKEITKFISKLKS